VRPEDAGDASRCQRAALACNDDAALVAAAPRAADLLARLGLALDDGGCVRASLCGNGQLDDGEECDDGSANSDTLPDHCRTDCSDPWCGDGVVDPGNGEECEPPGTLLCDADCQDSLPLGPLGGLVRVRAAAAPAVAQADGTATAPPEALAACQQAILRGARRLFDRTRRPLERCVARLAHCFVGPDGGSDACLAHATAPCQAVVAERDALRGAAVGRTLPRCAAVSPAQLLDPAGGLGFARTAASCPFPAAGAPGAADVVDCAYRTVACAAEAAVARVMPSAYGMLGGADLDPDAAFPCVTDPEAE